MAFPDADRFMAAQIDADGSYQRAHLTAALRLVTDTRCAIDGGAHIGTWSRLMSQHFDRVVAFEPSPDTFECLQWNVAAAGATNVECLPYAAGECAGQATMKLDPENEKRENTGARYAAVGSGPIPVITIDSLKLPALGFLKLDVEGSELVALRGAAETIARCRPIVLYENKKLWYRHFGASKNAVQVLLIGLGYREQASVGCDVIWGPA